MTNPNQPGNLEVKLIGLTGPYRGNSYEFRGSEFLVGRIPNCDLVLVENTISAQHSKIVKTGDRYEIQDLRSTNGTFVNGVKVDRKILRTGDKLKFDQAEFEFINLADASRTMMATPEAMAGLAQTIARTPHPVQPQPPSPAYATPPPAYVPSAHPPRPSAAAAKGSLFSGSILGVLVATLLVYLVYLVVVLVQSQTTAGMSAANVGDILKSFAGIFPGMHTHAGWKMTGLRNVSGIVILIALIVAPIAGGLVAQAVGKRSRAKTALSFSLLYLVLAVVLQFVVMQFKVNLWPTAFPPLLTSIGVWGNAALGLAYFWGVVFVLSFLGALLVRTKAD